MFIEFGSIYGYGSEKQTHISKVSRVRLDVNVFGLDLMGVRLHLCTGEWKADISPRCLGYSKTFASGDQIPSRIR